VLAVHLPISTLSDDLVDTAQVWEGVMARKSSRTRFWTVLAIINVAVMAYPVAMYIRADSNDSQFYAALVVLGIGFLLAIMDTVSGLVVYMDEMG
jgi:hypothetical protein